MPQDESGHCSTKSLHGYTVQALIFERLNWRFNRNVTHLLRLDARALKCFLCLGPLRFKEG